MERGKRKMSSIKDYKLADLSEHYYNLEIGEIADSIAIDLGIATTDTKGCMVGFDHQAFADSLSETTQALADMAQDSSRPLFDAITEADYSRVSELLGWFDKYVPAKTMSKWRAYSAVADARDSLAQGLVDVVCRWELCQLDTGFDIVESMMPIEWDGKEVVEKCGFIGRTYDSGRRLKENHDRIPEIPF